MRWSRGAAAAATVAALALGAVACNDETPAAPAPAGSAASPAPSGAGGPGAGGGPSATGGAARPTASAQAGGRCRTAELTADIQIQPDHLSSAMVLLTNSGTRTCTVQGYLGYDGLQADNSPLRLATNRVAHPGAPVAVTLKPGTSAFSGLKWASCDKSSPTCHSVATVVVTPPDETTQLTARVLGTDGKPLTEEMLAVSAAGFTVGSLQPSNQGVVFP
ncbi:DUF4232 domain-containing protein [Kitasatospora sp. NPDC058965]|uniref:DUF4232 domain-containing protein n=1 Tax=Kitasatospora sp. NPDC058965 TaxID=3346682 RepID=UPI00367B8C73